METLGPKIYTKQDKEEKEVKLARGDLFISIHHGADSIGMAFDKRSFNEKILLSNFEEAKKKLGLKDFKNCDLKIIGSKSSIIFCVRVCQGLFFRSMKEVEREGQFQVLYSPLDGRVRVTKDENVNNVRSLHEKIKVLIVDDSKTIRTILKKMFSNDTQFEVIGMLEKPSEVDAFIAKNKPDVITLDIHMPEMDGVTLLKKIFPKYKIPCVMISSISLAEGPLVFEALENGAVDYIQKPEARDIEALTPVILEKIKMAANVNTNQVKEKTAVVRLQDKLSLDSLIVMGSSTGGTEALREILTSLPEYIPPILIVQHIPPIFSMAFAKRMNDLCPFEVKEAENGDEVKTNRVLIAPGGKQMKFIHRNGKSYVEINDDEPVNRFKPSVDYLFDSVEKNMYCHTIAVILTGMGKDGAKGMLKLKEKGAITIAQNEETCVVFGMPREAIAIGGATYIEPLHFIATKITEVSKNKKIKAVGNL